MAQAKTSQSSLTHLSLILQSQYDMEYWLDSEPPLLCYHYLSHNIFGLSYGHSSLTGLPSTPVTSDSALVASAWNAFPPKTKWEPSLPWGLFKFDPIRKACPYHHVYTTWQQPSPLPLTYPLWPSSPSPPDVFTILSYPVRL